MNKKRIKQILVSVLLLPITCCGNPLTIVLAFFLSLRFGGIIRTNMEIKMHIVLLLVSTVIVASIIYIFCLEFYEEKFEERPYLAILYKFSKISLVQIPWLVIFKNFFSGIGGSSAFLILLIVLPAGVVMNTTLIYLISKEVFSQKIT